MNPADALDIGQAAIWTVVIAASPAVVAAMLVGILIALLQALTQIQEMTLTFVPKIIAILVVTSFTAPFVGSVIFAFAEQTYARIPNGF
ncbi:flagellar biosynthesis protein FliQ [Hyphomicrobium sp. LHD-15]|jgi:flagellar biosynthetic protein FliQ|uniref:flagellar biosynthesis protein FliQ n=1 Tax=Hyphomicrobium sp. LHD-15 TaxID=3072142 RepID=UPI00280F10E8|nr:flagellar biosynthesis protein FliQ [Hyphomicrobium sp. LHD-15]MDQ8699064.1 flagellar biosynthesis protein FliQ [Hyphomicrobium sp. LHD-15]